MRLISQVAYAQFWRNSVILQAAWWSHWWPRRMWRSRQEHRSDGTSTGRTHETVVMTTNNNERQSGQISLAFLLLF